MPRIPFLGVMDWALGLGPACDLPENASPEDIRQASKGISFRIRLDSQYSQNLPGMAYYWCGQYLIENLGVTNEQFRQKLDDCVNLPFSFNSFVVELMRKCRGTGFVVFGNIDKQIIEIAVENATEPIREATPFIESLCQKMTRWISDHHQT